MLDQLRQAVKEFGNDTRLARLAEVDQGGLCRFRQGRSELSYSNLVRVAEALGFRIVLVPGEPRSPQPRCKCGQPMGAFDRQCESCRAPRRRKPDLQDALKQSITDTLSVR